MRTLSIYRKSFKLSAIGVAALALGFSQAAQASIQFVNQLQIDGEATDLGGGATPNENRLGGFGSDLLYDGANNVWYGLVDRGPGGGVISYETRMQKFSVDINPASGAVSNFLLLDTIKFTDSNGAYNGLNPGLLNGNKAALGNSFDPEGLAMNKANGHFYVSDEYGPSVIEFDQTGNFVRKFTTPANLIPTQPDGADADTDPDLNYVDGRPTITSGRQDNRGFEGLTASPDGSKLYAVLQDPLVNEGDSNQGRRSRNVRIVEYDTLTGVASGQFVYQLESRDDINARIPGTGNDFSATSQGRNIGVSSIVALNDHEFLVLERDNRGAGVDDPTGASPVGTKRIYRIDITGATDVSAISLAGSNALPASVTPVSKQLYLDIQAALLAAGLPVVEKIEGLAFGPDIAGGRSLLLASDNDFSVTQTGAGEQFDVCSDGTQVALGAGCAGGARLLPSVLYAFSVVPEPVTGMLLLSGFGGLLMMRRRK
ncbi:MAG: esterase-like activity of phytase family protein [Pseudomonadota bacterium]